MSTFKQNNVKNKINLCLCGKRQYIYVYPARTGEQSEKRHDLETNLVAKNVLKSGCSLPDLTVYIQTQE
jgi:hypothetical protein